MGNLGEASECGQGQWVTVSGYYVVMGDLVCSNSDDLKQKCKQKYNIPNKTDNIEFLEH